MEYDDEHELTRYVWDYFSQHLTDFERRVGLAIHAQAKVANGSPAVARFMERRYSLAGDPAIAAALAGGGEAFRRRVCRRLLAEHGAEIVVNRCPACGRVVRTPKARQCFWCGHDWHGVRA